MSRLRKRGELSKRARGGTLQLLNHMQQCPRCNLPNDQVLGGRDLVLCPVAERILRKSGVRGQHPAQRR